VSRQVSELEVILGEMIAEHRRLLKQADAQQAAMKSLDLRAMDECAKTQEASRLRLANLETKRRLIVAQLARAHGVQGNLTIPQIADLYPQRKTMLLNLRETLKAEMTALATRNHVVGRLAGAVAGHLTTVVRLLAGAVEKAGLYTRQGIPQVANRIGVMEAIG
jgi:hypothetical protein